MFKETVLLYFCQENVIFKANKLAFSKIIIIIIINDLRFSLVVRF